MPWSRHPSPPALPVLERAAEGTDPFAAFVPQVVVRNDTVHELAYLAGTRIAD